MMDEVHGNDHPLEILDTRIKWANLQDELQKVLTTGSKCRRTSFAHQIPGSVGFLSQVVLIDLHWFPQVPKLPSKVVLKVPISKPHEPNPEDVETPAERLEPLLQALFQAEHSFYDFYRSIENLHIPKPPVPHFYYAAKFEKNHEYLVFEYLHDTHHFHIWDNFNETQIDQVLLAIAKTQACGYLRDSNSRPGLDQKMMKTLYKDCFPEMLELLHKMPAFYGEELQPLVEKLAQTHQKIWDLDIEKKVCKKLGIKPALIHGDMWSTNILWEADDHNKLRALLDWQMTHHGNPAADLIRLFNSCMSGVHRRRYWKDYLRIMHKHLTHAMGTHPVPYTYEQAFDAYVFHYPMETFLYLPPLNPIVANANRSEEPELAQKRKSIVAEKVKCMMEDILEFQR
ncbi:unnamed protein product, partial [Mesorhabditis belari]|uniref:CHK kinase-like domain-containing protein n=1 Tax=Mesorhabditis belari TaxID=2138241 RepID=A0AAF3FET6_9BILA